jgi:hypothetical protein
MAARIIAEREVTLPCDQLPLSDAHIDVMGEALVASLRAARDELLSARANPDPLHMQFAFSSTEHAVTVRATVHGWI